MATAARRAGAKRTAAERRDTVPITEGGSGWGDSDWGGGGDGGAEETLDGGASGGESQQAAQTPGRVLGAVASAAEARARSGVGGACGWIRRWRRCKKRAAPHFKT